MTIPKLETILCSVDDDLAIIRYNRPANANALDARTMRDIREALTWADGADAKVVLLTGEGKFFSAGMDLVGIPDDGPVLSDESVETLRLGVVHRHAHWSADRSFSEVHKLLINTKKVFIAAVNGPAVGWGTASIAISKSHSSALNHLNSTE